MAKWTLMVYLAGDNNLSEEMIYAIKEMYRVGVNDDINLTIQFDPSAIGSPIRRYDISRKTITKSRSDKAISKSFREEIQDSVKKDIHASLTTFKKVASLVAKDDLSKLGFAVVANKQPGKEPKNAAAAAKTLDNITEAVTGRPTSDPLVPEGLDLDGLIDELRVMDPKLKKLNYPKNKTRALALISAGEINSANPKALRDFIFWSITTHPAEYYMVVLSGHGSGAVGDFLRDENALKKERPTSLSIPNLEIALKGVQEQLFKARKTNLLKGGRIHILGMDSCLMSMVEVGYELRDSVEFLVGSEGFVLNTGWPYHRILRLLKDEPGMTPEKFAPAIVKTYISYYVDYEVAGASTDMSACNLAAFDQELKSKIEDLAQALIKALAERELKDAIVLAHWEAQSYKTEQYTDLYDFCDRLQLHCIRQRLTFDSLRTHAPSVLKALQSSNKDTEILEKTDEVLAVLSKEKDAALQIIKTLIKACSELKKTIKSHASPSCYSGPAFQHSHGLSVFFPWFEDKEALNAYEELAFANKIAIVMQEGLGEKSKQKAQDLKKRLKASTHLLEGDRSYSIIVENGRVDESKLKGKEISKVLRGTGWVNFLKKYLKATRRKPRNDKGLKDDKLKHIVPSVNTILAPFGTPVRFCNSQRGSGLGSGSMKNPPDGFFRDECT